MSEAVRQRVIEWYRSTLLSRGDDKTATRIVVVMQRVHQNDLVGYLQEQGGFEILNLPAIAQKNALLRRMRWLPAIIRFFPLSFLPSLPSCNWCVQPNARHYRHDFDSSVGELGCLHCCRHPCLAWIYRVSSLRDRCAIALQTPHAKPRRMRKTSHLCVPPVVACLQTRGDQPRDHPRANAK